MVIAMPAMGQEAAPEAPAAKPDDVKIDDNGALTLGGESVKIKDKRVTRTLLILKAEILGLDKRVAQLDRQESYLLGELQVANQRLRLVAQQYEARLAALKKANAKPAEKE